ncbi:MAG TPA: hypothetical protein VHB47_07560 [Thermoanaerobaculia bacterium]|nr:hypothetical protein [Thermoanaerobaculia bacterium]
MSGEAPERLLPRRVAATLVGLAVALAGLGMPGQLLASMTISCGGLLTAAPKQQQANAQLGWSIAVGQITNQTWLAVGANQDNGGAGSVFMFLNPTPPEARPPLVPPTDLQRGDQFGTSVSIDGNWLAVGAPLSGANGVRESGAVYLYLFDGSNWMPNAKLAVADAVVGAQFGSSVSLKGTTLVVGAPGDSDRGSLSGSVYVFALHGTLWQQTAKFHADDGRPFDEFGFAVAAAVAGDEIVVGAPFADDLQAFQNFGAVYVFEQTGSGIWALEASGKLTAGLFRPGNIQFGSAVAIGGDRIVVGARGDDLNSVTASGSAYVFERNGAGTAWMRLPALMAVDPQQGAQFGTAVWLDGDSVLIGAPFDGSNTGAAYLFERGDQGWQQKYKFLHILGVGAFGQSVAILGNQVFLGGPEYSSDGVTPVGAVATCPLPMPMPMPQPFLTCTKMGPKSVDAGGLATYKITVANTGDAAAANVMLDDPTPAGLAFVSAGPPCGAGFPCPLGPPLGAHETRGAVEVTFRAPAGCSARGSFTNYATVTGDGAEAGSCNAMPTTIVGRPPAVLSCAEQGPGTASPGDPVTYEVTVCNSGCEAAKDVILSDPTPPGLVLLGVGGGRCTQLPCNLGTIEPGQCLPPVAINFKLPAGCAPNSITNTAAVNGSNAARQACPQVVTSVDGGAVLGIVLSAPPQPFQVMGGESFKFSSVVSNAGPHTARDVTVTVSIGASAIVVSKPAGCSPVAPNQFTCPLGDLPCGGTVPLDFILQAPSCACCAAAGTSIDLAVDVHSRTPDPTPTLPTQASATVQVTCPKSPCLSITKTETPDPAAPGQGVVYDITVSNAGSAAASGAVVEDHYPPELHDVLWCRGAACAPNLYPPLLDTIDLAAGETRIYRLSGNVHPMCSGVLHNLATVTPPSGVCNDPARTQFSLDTQVAATGVYAFCAGFSGEMLPSTPITKTMLLINCGPANQADNPGDEFTDTLPAGLTLTGASATSGTASTSGNTVTWNGAIPVGGTVTITMTANIGAGTTGMVLCNQATVFYDADGDGINDSMRLSDDPDEPGPADPCCFQVVSVIPALSLAGLAALALLLAGLALWRLR